MTETTRSEIERNGDDTHASFFQRLRSWLPLGNSDTGSVRDVIEELIEDQPDTDDAIDEHE
ncbi:MAG: hypothetical protein RJS98_02375, partial [Rhodospirillaceae bacterium]